MPLLKKTLRFADDYMRKIPSYSFLHLSRTTSNHCLKKSNRHLSVADEVEKTITAELKRAEQLRQSILKQAFSGKLVPQGPNDEPASVLLERIKAEKAQHIQGQLRLKLV